jgi:ATP-dependent RNA helicase DDX46/PRP5
MTEAQRVAHLEKRQVLIEAGLLDPDKEDPLLQTELDGGFGTGNTRSRRDGATKGQNAGIEIPKNLTPELLALPGMKEALLRKAGIHVADSESKMQEENNPSQGNPVQTGDNHWVQEFESNDYPREARWKVTQKETTSRMQDEFRTAVTLKGSYFPPGKEPTAPSERKIYLHLEATSGTILRSAVLEIQRMLNDETLRVSVKAATSGGSGSSSHQYNVLS